MKNKKSIMTFAGIQILLFHLWVNVGTSNTFEMFLRQTAYIGVDLFFFVSGFSLGEKREKFKDFPGDYGRFLGSRFGTVYLKFMIFTILAAWVSSWSFTKFVQTLSGAALWLKGGGSFLWFLPAIMWVYIFAPVIQQGILKGRERWKIVPVIADVIILVLWFAVGVAVTYFTSYKSMFIFWNRIPVLWLGFILAKSGWFRDRIHNTWKSILWGLVFLIIGTVLLYFFGFRERLQVPIYDMFYVMGIPATLGLVFLFSQIPSVKIISKIGSSTLEMYGLQMVFGYSYANWVYKNTKSPWITNLSSLIVITLAAVLCSEGYRFVHKKIVK